jgi:hypothetical protein
VGWEKALVVSGTAEGVLAAGGVEGGTMGGSHDEFAGCLRQNGLDGWMERRLVAK